MCVARTVSTMRKKIMTVHIQDRGVPRKEKEAIRRINAAVAREQGNESDTFLRLKNSLILCALDI